MGFDFWQRSGVCARQRWTDAWRVLGITAPSPPNSSASVACSCNAHIEDGPRFAPLARLLRAEAAQGQRCQVSHHVRP
jgi:hypothetical protein